MPGLMSTSSVPYAPIHALTLPQHTRVSNSRRAAAIAAAAACTNAAGRALQHKHGSCAVNPTRACGACCCPWPWRWRKPAAAALTLGSRYGSSQKSSASRRGCSKAAASSRSARARTRGYLFNPRTAPQHTCPTPTRFTHELNYASQTTSSRLALPGGRGRRLLPVRLN